MPDLELTFVSQFCIFRFEVKMKKLTIVFFFVLFFMNNFAQADLLPIEAFGKMPTTEQIKLSPDGKKVAFIRHIAGHSLIGITNIKTSKSKFITRTDNQKFKISWYVWANNNLLLIKADYPVKVRSLKYRESRLLKINADGNSPVTSVIIARRKERIPQIQTKIIDLLPDDADHILMALDLRKHNLPDVYKIDLNSQKEREIIYSAKPNIHNWMTDRQHRVRLGFGRDDTKIFYRLFDLQLEKWRNIWEYEIFDAPDISPLGFGLDPNQLYIRALHQGRYAIFKVNLATKDLVRELVYADKNYDIEGSLIYSRKTNDVVGVYHGEASDSKIYFEPSYATFQKALNKALPDAYNNISNMSANEKKYILYSSGKNSPGAYYFGDKETGEIMHLVEQYPMLHEQKLSGKRKVTYNARDGLEVEAYVTLPYANVKTKGAAIIIPHGGPMSRNYGGFDWFSEFFASRGYTVLEPNFRGSSGYGFDFEMQSIQQWGGAMQDDLQDGARWLADNYTIDRKRICILGGSYGGYAALMASAKQQETFRCAASFAGVSDLEYIVKKARKFTNYKVVKKQIGDDRDRLEQNSPINFARDIDIPVLLIHGDKDRVVDVSHSRRMYKELTDYKKKVEYIELENGNHYLEIEANRLKTLEAMERFLNKYLDTE